MLIGFSAAKAQTPTHWPERYSTPLSDSALIPHVNHVFYTETGMPFFTWDIKPVEFEFVLYNRWGKRMVQTTDPDFILDSLLEKNNKLPLETYVAKITFTSNAGEKRSFTLQYRHLGFYCAG